jgi:hypothetical protein
VKVADVNKHCAYGVRQWRTRHLVLSQPAKYNKKKMGGWGLSAGAERNLSEFMRSPPAVPSIHV